MRRNDPCIDLGKKRARQKEQQELRLRNEVGQSEERKED